MHYKHTTNAYMLKNTNINTQHTKLMNIFFTITCTTITNALGHRHTQIYLK